MEEHLPQFSIYSFFFLYTHKMSFSSYFAFAFSKKIGQYFIELILMNLIYLLSYYLMESTNLSLQFWRSSNSLSFKLEILQKKSSLVHINSICLFISISSIFLRKCISFSDRKWIFVIWIFFCDKVTAKKCWNYRLVLQKGWKCFLLGKRLYL